MNCLSSLEFNVGRRPDTDLLKVRLESRTSVIYPVRYRFDLKFTTELGSTPSQQRIQTWSAAFDKDTDFGEINQSVDFDVILFRLDDITTLYRKQITAGHKDRISRVSAPGIAAWGVRDSKVSHPLHHTRSLSSTSRGTGWVISIVTKFPLKLHSPISLR